MSVKKLHQQGDVRWATRGTILGWDFDKTAGTLNLPPHRLARLYTLLDAIPTSRKRAPFVVWHQLLGEPLSKAAALPGALHSPRLRPQRRPPPRSAEPSHSRQYGFRAIADTLQARPTRFQELIPVGPPVARRACDTCQRGMGEVWFGPGEAPISDLELAGTLAHKHVLTQAVPEHLAERPIWLAGDNRPSLAWATRVGHHQYRTRLPHPPQRFAPVPFLLRTTTRLHLREGQRDGRRCQSMLGLVQQCISHLLRLHLSTDYLLDVVDPGSRDALCGDCALLRRRSTPITLHIAAPPRPLPLLTCGHASVLSMVYAPTCATSPATSCPSCSSSSPNTTAPAALHLVTGPFDLERWRTPSAK